MLAARATTATTPAARAAAAAIAATATKSKGPPDHVQHDISGWDIGQIPEGLHIYVQRRQGYTHHGIYIGDGKVIHFVGPKAGPTRACNTCGFSINTGHGVVETCLECFLHGGSLCRYYYNMPGMLLDAICPNCSITRRWESGSPIVETAKEKLKQGFGKYDLLSNNCEHFATFCSSGKAFCQQFIYSAASLAAGPSLPRGGKPFLGSRSS